MKILQKYRDSVWVGCERTPTPFENFVYRFSEQRPPRPPEVLCVVLRVQYYAELFLHLVGRQCAHILHLIGRQSEQATYPPSLCSPNWYGMGLTLPIVTIVACAPIRARMQHNARSNILSNIVTNVPNTLMYLMLLTYIVVKYVPYVAM